MITFTDNAIKALKSLANDEGINSYNVRLRVIGGGCAGFTYDMYFEDKINEMDEVTEIGDVKVIVDPLSLQYLENVEVDYIDSQFGRGFKFNNPNVKGSCGCGSSVSF